MSTYNIPNRSKQAQAWGAWEALIQRFDAHTFPVIVANDYEGPALPAPR